jgi:hypothetical protein
MRQERGEKESMGSIFEKCTASSQHTSARDPE